MYEIGKYTAGIKAGLEIAQRISEEFGEKVYPEDVFPLDGKSQDCMSARMARITCANIVNEISHYVHANMPKLEEPES